MKNPHSELKRHALLALSAAGLGRFWNNETGVALAGRYTGGGWILEQPVRPIRYGLNGSSDILGILKGGMFFGGEVKTGNAVQSKQQKAFENMIVENGGLYIVIRSVEQAVIDVEYFLYGKGEK